MALLLVPGPVVLYTVTRSIHQGRESGILSTLAVGLGDFCHVLMATLGLSALLLSSAIAFNIVKYAGAAYLIYLGVRTLIRREAQQETSVADPIKLTRVFSQGFLVSLLNPKTALFFMAFLPQFIDPTKSAISGQILFLGTLFVVLGVCTNIVYVLLASMISRWIRGNSSFSNGQRYFTGSVYLALGVTTAFTGTNNSQ
ncbi:LysE family translocator [Chloroflexi bacterium TSY]|nr:LysE family translocator [Chloroflexi bacterium TSY]